MNDLNVYDFDGTIYDGDSSVDFFLFCIKNKPAALFRCLFTQLAGMILYVFKRISKEKYKEMFFSFLQFIPADEILLARFWDRHFVKIKQWYLLQKKEDDIIISASPEFLLRCVCDKLGTELIASRIDPATGKFFGLNCLGKEKVRRFYESHPDGIIDSFYTDSMSDLPMIHISSRSFLVKKDTVSIFVPPSGKGTNKERYH